MSKINSLTKSVRGIAICSKCGKQIKPGEKYYKATPFRRNPIIRCYNCGLKPYETSTSIYKQSIGYLKDNWQKTYTIDSDIVNNIISYIEELKDDVENNLFRLPDQFQDRSILQDRFDELENCIDALENIDVYDYDEDDEEEYENFKSDMISEINGALSYI